MSMMPPLSLDLNATGNTTNCYCCMGDNAIVNTSNTTTNNAAPVPAEEDGEARMIFNGKGLSPEAKQTASLVRSCVRSLDCFADVRALNNNALSTSKCTK
jgi:hypothetical protein